ncbi:MAG: CCA tRNA nucleotidyltransferase, partial [Betaproteobacteria bacterium]|nr:CCA tRNA nucleotidyltransferase [Betaproteobacteria bacterium]
MKIKRYQQFINENKISTEISLPNDIIEISNAYIKAGKDIFLVGGAVRDFIQGIEPKDYDLVTNALPNESKEILKGFNVSDEQGKNFGVLRVYTKDEPEGYEVASYRRDISGGRDTKGDDQKVEMGGDVTIEDDCNRRDLTMNALFYDIKNKQIVDLVGGVEDIKKGIVRAVGDASQRFIEDRLRICRIFRFAARTGGEIDSKTAQAIKNDNRLKGVGPKDDVSQERIWDELKKSWKQAKDFRNYLQFFTKFDMWDEVFPNSNINTDLVDSKDFIVVIA